MEKYRQLSSTLHAQSVKDEKQSSDDRKTSVKDQEYF